MNKTTFGKAGEQYACKFLEKSGYRILAVNYKAGGGELDIVALKRGTIVFAEVKTRSDSSFGTPAEAVGEKKITCLRSAAVAFMYEQCSDGKVAVFLKFGIKIRKRVKNTRNDIIEVFTSKGVFAPYKINHIKDAF